MAQIKDRIAAHRSDPDTYDPPTFEEMARYIDKLEREAKIQDVLLESIIEGRDATIKHLLKRLQNA